MQDRQALFELIETNTDAEQKKRILQTFAPTIALSKLIDL
jgi:hypothetical protein